MWGEGLAAVSCCLDHGESVSFLKDMLLLSTPACRPTTATKQHPAKDKENKPVAPANSAAMPLVDNPKPPARAARKVGFATDKQDLPSKVDPVCCLQRLMITGLSW